MKRPEEKRYKCDQCDRIYSAYYVIFKVNDGRCIICDGDLRVMDEEEEHHRMVGVYIRGKTGE